jgi:hypothetical protein
MLLSEGQMSDYKGAELILPVLPKAKELLGDKGYDASWFRAALAERGIAACIRSKSNRKCRSHMTERSTGNATKSKICLAGSRTGGEFISDTTDALTHSCPPYISPQPSDSGSDQ